MTTKYILIEQKYPPPRPSERFCLLSQAITHKGNVYNVITEVTSHVFEDEALALTALMQLEKEERQ
jgi:hypothetical protein